MKAQQRIWVNRINNMFTFALGLLAGFGVMHIIFLVSARNEADFLNAYSGFANTILTGTQFFGNLTLIFGLTMYLIYRQTSRIMIENRHRLRNDIS